MIVPAIRGGATLIDQVFGEADDKTTGRARTPRRSRELRHSFVSLMSRLGVLVEEIARLAGHSNTRTTEVVYRRELRPVLTTGAEAMDRLFGVHVS